MAGIVIAVVVLCLLAEGFFSGSELAMVACDKLRLKRRSLAGRRGARIAMSLLAKPERLLSITLLGTNLSTITATAVVTFYLLDRFGPSYGSWAILLAPIILIFAEIVPKSIYHHHADRVVDRVAPLLHLFGTLLFPVVWGVQRVTERLLRGVRRAAAVEPRITRDELAALLLGDETKETDIRPSERTMVSRVLRLAELTAKNVMVPLTELELLPITATREAAFAICDLKGYPRIPVYANRVYDVVGLVDATDVVCANPDQPLRELIHQPVYVPKNMRLNELFRLLRERKEEAAVVVDEYGAAVGIVTREDLFGEIVGEIRDEFELDEQLFRQVAPQRYFLNARMEVERVHALLGLEVPTGDFETLGGLLLARFGHLPRVGETIAIGPWQFSIRQVSDRAIIEVEARPLKT